MAEIKNIPELRFPEFTGKWNEKKFGELYTFKPTNSFSRDMLNYESGSLKNIHYGDIHTKFNLLFDIDKENVPFVNSYIKINGIADDNYVQEGDLILADASEDYNDIGKSIEIVNLNNEKVVSGLHTILSRQKTDELAIGFMAFQMKTFKVRLEIMRMAQGTKVLGLSSKRLAEIPLWIPQKKEQEKIATFLTAIDKRITILSNQKDQLELYKKGLLQKIFNKELRFKDDDGEEFPDWVEKKIKDVFFVTRGYVLAVKELKQQISAEYIYPVYSSQTTNNGLMGFYNKSLYENAITWTTDGANAGEVKYREGKFYCTNVCGVLISEDGNANKCIAELLNGVTKKYVSYVGNPKLMNNIMSEIKINFPGLKEQHRIASFINIIDEQIEQAKYQIDESVKFKKGLSQKLFV